MKLLALDYGTKHIGLASYNTEVKVILPLAQVNSLAEVINLIKQEEINKIIVGLPLGMKGEENFNTKRIRKFVANLQQKIKVNVEFVDERFSSQQADQMGGGVSRDEKAAMVIMQTYLDR